LQVHQAQEARQVLLALRVCSDHLARAAQLAPPAVKAQLVPQALAGRLALRAVRVCKAPQVFLAQQGNKVRLVLLVQQDCRALVAQPARQVLQARRA
jgi:hypothetical protein